MHITIIDCRKESDYQESHILESVNIPYSTVSFHFISIDDLSSNHTLAAISSSVCQFGLESLKCHFICFYGDSL